VGIEELKRLCISQRFAATIFHMGARPIPDSDPKAWQTLRRWALGRLRPFGNPIRRPTRTTGALARKHCDAATGAAFFCLPTLGDSRLSMKRIRCQSPHLFRYPISVNHL
jgi:hypothetical protein